MEDIKNDHRFAHIATDPQFRFMPKAKRKVRIDSRFQSVFSDRRFNHKTGMDKRGRPALSVNTKQSQHVMQRFYDVREDDQVPTESDQEITDFEPEQPIKKRNKIETIESRSAEKSDSGFCMKIDNKKKSKSDQNSKSSISSKKTQARKTAKEKSQYYLSSQEIDICQSLDKLAPEDAVSSKCSSDDDSPSDDELQEFTQEHVLEETEVDHKWNELHEDAPAVVESTHRLAVCNMDWDFVKAQDLFVLFRSFIPEGGSIKSVTIYPSEFGKERMAEEVILGPREMREQSHKRQVTNKDKKKKQVSINQQQVKHHSKELETENIEKLREYQLNRLRYYFAVVICDSVRTAETVYSECDGREYLLSSVRLDLRFIPDTMTFDDLPKDAFSESNSILEYEPNRFNTTALSQAKVDVTWDETDFDRLSRQLAGLQHKELESIVEENKYADIIAPPESDSDEDEPNQPDWLKHATEEGIVFSEEEKIALYRRLLVDKLNDEEEGDKEDDMEGGKEFVWQPGLKSSLVSRMQRKEKKEAVTGVVSEYLEKKREKKKIKENDKMKKKNVEINEGHTLDEVAESCLQKRSVNQRNLHEASSGKIKKKRKTFVDRGKETETSGEADLELLVMDGNDNMKLKNKDDAGKKKRKKSKRKRLSDEKDNAPLDMSDSRFAALYTSHHFHIDPTATQFKKTKGMSALVNEQIKRRGQYARPQPSATGSKLNTPEHQADGSQSLTHLLVESLRSKMRK